MEHKTIPYTATLTLAWLIAVFGVVAFFATIFFTYSPTMGLGIYVTDDYKWFRSLVGLGLFGGVPCLILSTGIAVASFWKHLPVWYLFMSLALALVAPATVLFGAIFFL